MECNKRPSGSIMAVSDRCVWASALHGLLALTANNIHCSHPSSAELTCHDGSVVITTPFSHIILVYFLMFVLYIETCTVFVISTLLVVLGVIWDVYNVMCVQGRPNFYHCFTGK